MARTRRERRQAAAADRQAAARGPAPAPPAGARLAQVVRTAVRNRPLALAAALVALHVALALLTFEPQPHTGGDNAAYITLGRSLLDGRYAELWEPGAPPHIKYPPVFPGVLAIALALGLQPWVQLKLVVLAFSATAVAFSFLWTRARGHTGLALGVGLLLAVAPGILREGRWILSDVPFWAFTMVALWAFERLKPDDHARFAIAAGATLLAYFTRSAGIPLVVAALVWLAWRRHWRQLAVLAIAIGVPAVLWTVRSRLVGGGAYVSEFWLINPYQPALGTIGPADLLARIVENVGRYVSIHLPILLSGRQPTGFLLLSVTMVLVGVYGWAARLREARAAELFLPLYLGLIFIWPAVWSGERFLLPALPALLVFAGTGLGRLVRRLAPRHDFVAGAAAVSLIALLTLPAHSHGARIGSECRSRYVAGEPYACLPGPHWFDFFRLAEVSAQALPDDAVVLSRKPRLYYVLSGRAGRTYPFVTDDGAAFFAAAEDLGARYVVFDRLDAVSDRYLRPVLLRRPDAFCLLRVEQLSGTVLFGIRDEAARRAPPAREVQGEEVTFTTCEDDYWRTPEARRKWGVQQAD